jgi:outer membrane murein-binding lipoprotein Lpp
LSEADGMSNQRMNQLNSELRDLNAELVSLQARALRRIEELENDFDGVELPSDVQVMFFTMQRLITKV